METRIDEIGTDFEGLDAQATGLKGCHEGQSHSGFAASTVRPGYYKGNLIGHRYSH